MKHEKDIKKAYAAGWDDGRLAGSAEAECWPTWKVQDGWLRDKADLIEWTPGPPSEPGLYLVKWKDGWRIEQLCVQWVSVNVDFDGGRLYSRHGIDYDPDGIESNYCLWEDEE